MVDITIVCMIEVFREVDVKAQVIFVLDGLDVADLQALVVELEVELASAGASGAELNMKAWSWTWSWIWN